MGVIEEPAVLTEMVLECALQLVDLIATVKHPAAEGVGEFPDGDERREFAPLEHAPGNGVEGLETLGNVPVVDEEA